MPVLQLNYLVDALHYQYIHYPNPRMNIDGISCDSRQVKPGDLFIALRGQEHDGHNFISQALNNGAAAVIAEEKPGANPPPVNWIQVPDTRLALAQAAAMFYHHPSRELSLIGVTGTSGKTTTTCMLHHIYRTAKLNAGLVGTVQIHCGKDCWPARMTTPDALELQRMLRLMVDSGASHAAMEVSSHGLHQKRVDEIHFQGAIFTNISPNHLDFHQSLVDYASAKARLATLVKDGGFLLVNGDDPYFKKLKPVKNNALILLGSQHFCHLFIQVQSIRKEGSVFQLSVTQSPTGPLTGTLSRKDPYIFTIPVPGKHNVFNAASAAAAALLSGVPEEDVSRGLKTFPGVRRRFNFHQVGSLHVIDDTAMSPGSIHAVFHTLQELSLARNRLVLVYALRGRRGTVVNEDNGRALAGWVKYLGIEHFFSTSSVHHVKETNRVTPEEEAAFFQGTLYHGISPVHTPSLEETIAKAVEVLTPGTTLLLLGAQGMDSGLDVFLHLFSETKIPAALS